MNNRFFKLLLVQLVLLCAGVCCAQEVNQEVKIKRLNKRHPVICMKSFVDAGYDQKDGSNINGPSVIKLPDWLPVEKRVNKKAKYYLYFAHHHGKYIRLAWAKKVTGPYHLVQDSPLYGSYKDAVLHLDADYLDAGKTKIVNHVASPVVVVDHTNKLFKLYFHSPSRLKANNKNIGQQTFFATSEDGLEFNDNIVPLYLGSFYFSPFQVRNRWYAFANHGYIYEAPKYGEIAVPMGFNSIKPLWTLKKDFFKNVIHEYCVKNNIQPEFGVRHLSQIVKGNTLYVFFSSRDDTPERLYCTKVDISNKDFRKWKAKDLTLVMTAEEDWEGGNLPPKKSTNGFAPQPVNEIRDTFIFEADNGNLYLFYCAGGERGIGVASLKINE